MKKTLLFWLSITLLLSTFGCSKVEEVPSEELSDTVIEQKPPVELTKVTFEQALQEKCNTTFDGVAMGEDEMMIYRAFQRVILCGDSFADITDGTISDKTIDDIYKVGSDLEMSDANKNFAIVDLDGDGVAEVVLSLAAGNNEYPYGFAILRYGEDGAIRCYHTGYREFHELKTNGTFTSSGGANDWAICSVDSFGLEDMTVDKDMWCQSTSQNGDLEVCFYHRGVQIDERTFFSMFEEYEAKKNVSFHHISEFEEKICNLVS